MQILRDDLEWAADQGIVSREQSAALWSALSERAATRQKFDAPHVAYYFGALIILGGMGWFMNEAWDSLGGAGLAAIAGIYAVVFAVAGRIAWDKYQLRVPGGLLFTVAVWMTPIIVYGIERVTGMWPEGNPGTYREYHIWIRGSWIVMEAATIIVGAIVLRFRRFPFLTFPIAFALWYMSMDLTPLITGANEYSWEERALISAIFGTLVLVAAWIVDMRNFAEDYAFWGYLFGLLAFWGGLSSLDSNSEVSKFLYLLINLGLIVLSLLLRQRVFVVFGALGVFGYVGHLAWTVFRDSMMFPFALTILGVAVIVLGVLFQRRRARLEQWLASRVPARLQRLVPRRAAGD